MHRFFLPREKIGDAAFLTGDDAHHAANALRIRVHESVIICDGEGMDYICEVAEISKLKIALRITSSRANTAELPFRITLFQGLPKGDKLEQIIQKATELGAAHIIPVMCARSIPKIGNADSKLARLGKIAEAAAKQSHRGMIPQVGGFISLDEAIAAAVAMDAAYACNIGGERKFKLENISNLGIFIGPEGGFAPEEAERFAQAGIPAISLGRSILRTETAAIAALANIQYEMGAQTWSQ